MMLASGSTSIALPIAVPMALASETRIAINMRSELSSEGSVLSVTRISWSSRFGRTFLAMSICGPSSSSRMPSMMSLKISSPKASFNKVSDAQNISSNRRLIRLKLAASGGIHEGMVASGAFSNCSIFAASSYLLGLSVTGGARIAPR